jgi:hypothetical protein
LDNQCLPFIDPVDFGMAKFQDKLFIYGSSGSGESRVMFEIIKDKQEMLKHIENNTQFAIGFGEGIGQNFIYLKDENAVMQDNFLSKAKSNIHFAKGLGIGAAIAFE